MTIRTCRQCGHRLQTYYERLYKPKEGWRAGLYACWHCKKFTKITYKMEG